MPGVLTSSSVGKAVIGYANVSRRLGAELGPPMPPESDTRQFRKRSVFRRYDDCLADNASFLRPMGSNLPILNLQSRHPPEFIGIVRYQNQVSRYGLPGDQHVVGADRRSFDGQGGADFAGLARVFLVEIQDLELQAVHQRNIARGALALERAVEKFVADGIAQFPEPGQGGVFYDGFLRA